MAENRLADLSIKDQARFGKLPAELELTQILALTFPGHAELKALPDHERQEQRDRIKRIAKLLVDDLSAGKIQAKITKRKLEPVHIPKSSAVHAYASNEWPGRGFDSGNTRNFSSRKIEPRILTHYHVQARELLNWLSATQIWRVIDKDALIWRWWPEENYPAAFETGETTKASRTNTLQDDNTLKALGLLALIISRQTKRYQKADSSPNAKEIQETVFAEAERLGINTRGLSTALRNKITDGVKLLFEEVPPDKASKILK